MTRKNDDLIGKSKAKFLNATKSVDRLTGGRNTYNQYIFNSKTASTWRARTVDTIFNYRRRDHISYTGKIYKKDIKKVDGIFDALTGEALRSTVGKFHLGTRHGVSVDPSSRHYAQWVNSGKQYFKPYEINSIYIRSNNSTFLLINDHTEGFD